MQDTVYIRGLEIRSILGIHDWERRERQTIRIDIEMATDVRPAAASESIEQALDYRAVAKAVIAHVEENHYFLVETLAERLAGLIRQDFGVPWLRLTVGKPGAVRFSEEVGVVIERGRRDPRGA
jgi:dihydroneopterin aldolase